MALAIRLHLPDTETLGSEFSAISVRARVDRAYSAISKDAEGNRDATPIPNPARDPCSNLPVIHLSSSSYYCASCSVPRA